MALVAGIGCAHNHGQIRAGYAHTVITATVYTHVCVFGHMTVGAACPRAVNRMKVVVRRVIGGSLVALGAHTIACGPQGIAMWLMAIGANDACLVHLALHEGTVNIDLIKNLAIVVIKRRLKHGQAMSIEQVGAIVVIA